MKIKELYEKIRDGIIISDIELQREIIYNTEKQQLVIDSILNDVPLPAFYLWKNDDEKLEVLDGKQRIEAIKKFIQNDLQYNDKIWKQTDSDVQQKFNEKVICFNTLSNIYYTNKKKQTESYFIPKHRLFFYDFLISNICSV